MKRFGIFILLLFFVHALSFSQKRVLFDATKAETANNADWIIDADQWNLVYNNGSAYLGGSEANAQRYPTPDQSGITSSTSETYWTGALSAWGVELVQAGYHVETLPYDGQITYGDASNPQDLSKYDMYVVCEPNFPFTSSEKQAILKYVYNGGVLFMIADHDRSDRDGDGWDSPHVWNDLMQNNSVKTNPFGITFDYNNFRKLYGRPVDEPDNHILHGPYGDATQLEYFGGTTMTIDPEANENVHPLFYDSDVTQHSGNTRVMVAYSRFGQGLVFAFGDSSPFDDGTGDSHDKLYDGWYKDANGNHRILIMNASVYALKRVITDVENNMQNDDYKVIVNNGMLKIMSLDGAMFEVKIFSLTGSLLQQASARGIYSYGLVPGVYIVEIVTNQGVIRRKIAVF